MKILYSLLLLSILASVLVMQGIQVVSADTGVKLTPYVSDFANLLTPDQESMLNAQISAIEKNTTVEIAVVTIDTINDDPTLYAAKLGDENGVGKKATDNGVVILWVVESKRGGIATGRGIESVLTDAKVVNIGKANKQLFLDGKTYEAFSGIIGGLEKEITGSQSGVQTAGDSENTETDNMTGIIIGIGIFVFLMIIIISIASQESDSEGSKGFIFSSGGGSSSGSSGGRGFGGGSFGGGGGGF